MMKMKKVKKNYKTIRKKYNNNQKNIMISILILNHYSKINIKL